MSTSRPSMRIAMLMTSIIAMGMRRATRWASRTATGIATRRWSTAIRTIPTFTTGTGTGARASKLVLGLGAALALAAPAWRCGRCLAARGCLVDAVAPAAERLGYLAEAPAELGQCVVDLD